MYVLYRSIPYEPDYEECSGSLEEIKDWLRANKGKYYLDDLCLMRDSDVDLYKLAGEAYAEPK